MPMLHSSNRCFVPACSTVFRLLLTQFSIRHPLFLTRSLLCVVRWLSLPQSARALRTRIASDENPKPAGRANGQSVSLAVNRYVQTGLAKGTQAKQR